MTYTLSIEPTEGKAFQYGWNLGTIESVARDIAEEVFHNRRWFASKGNVTVRTVALIRDGKMVDCFDGEWVSDSDDPFIRFPDEI